MLPGSFAQKSIILIKKKIKIKKAATGTNRKLGEGEGEEYDKIYCKKKINKNENS